MSDGRWGLNDDLLGARDEEARLALDVVLLDVGGLELEVDRHAARREAVVLEIFGRLDVVLIVVRPVQMYEVPPVFWTGS